MAKPPTKPGKPTPAESVAVAKPKSKLIFLIAAGVLLLGAVGGGAAYFIYSSGHAKDAAKEHASVPPKFIPLEPFTVNLQKSEEGEKFLQAGITLKIANLNPSFEEKIKASMPEIRSRLLLLLSSKRDSELISIDGKKKLAREIISETNAVLGLRTAAIRPVAHAPKPAAPEGSTAPETEHTPGEAAPAETAPAPAEAAPAEVASNAPSIMEVLFTSFIIQ